MCTEWLTQFCIERQVQACWEKCWIANLLDMPLADGSSIMTMRYLTVSMLLRAASTDTWESIRETDSIRGIAENIFDDNDDGL